MCDVLFYSPLGAINRQRGWGYQSPHPITITFVHIKGDIFKQILDGEVNIKYLEMEDIFSSLLQQYGHNGSVSVSVTTLQYKSSNLHFLTIEFLETKFSCFHLFYFFQQQNEEFRIFFCFCFSLFISKYCFWLRRLVTYFIIEIKD